FARPTGRRNPSSPAVWSKCPCDSTITSTSLAERSSRRMFSTMPSGVTPVSNRKRCTASPERTVTSAENPCSAWKASMPTPASSVRTATVAIFGPPRAGRLAGPWSGRSMSVTLSQSVVIVRIERLNPQLNCVIFPRYEKALAEARGPGRTVGMFRGVPFLMKDLLQTVAGEPFSWGWKAFKDAGLVAPSTSYVAAKLAAAGLITLAQTTVPEWGTTLSTETRAWGPTRNPWDTARTAGGSSGGAAAAVSSGLVPIAHGNDAGGSIRIPASFCGLVGLNGSRGRTSLGPAHAELWHGLCEEGALTRTVRDAAAALDVVAGYMPGDPWMAPPPPRPFRDQVGQPPGRLRIGFMDRAPRFHRGRRPEGAAPVRGAATLLEP